MTIWGALAGGFVGTLVLTSGMRFATELRMTRIDLPFLLGTAFESLLQLQKSVLELRELASENLLAEDEIVFDLPGPGLRLTRLPSRLLCLQGDQEGRANQSTQYQSEMLHTHSGGHISPKLFCSFFLRLSTLNPATPQI